MSEKRLMMTEEEVRKRTKELLQKTPDDLITSYMFQEQEVKRLNNIINEFEEWLDTIPNYFMDTRSNNTGVYVQKGMQQMIDMSKNKLHELKGSDKE